MTNHDGRDWLNGTVTERTLEEGVILGEDEQSYRFTNGCLCRNRTYYENTVVGCTVYFGKRLAGVAEIVSWTPPSGLTSKQILDQHVAVQAQALADNVDAEVLRRMLER